MKAYLVLKALVENLMVGWVVDLVERQLEVACLDLVELLYLFLVLGLGL